MNVSAFGSYSHVEYTDLYYANVRSWHKYFYTIVYHINDDHIEYYSDKIDTIPITPNTYYFGLLSDSLDNITIEENYFGINYSSNIRKHNEYVTLYLENNILNFSTSEPNTICVNHHDSISMTFINGYDYIEKNTEYQINIRGLYDLKQVS